MAGATGVFWMKDLEVGDSIAAVTALAPAKGHAGARRQMVEAAAAHRPGPGGRAAGRRPDRRRRGRHRAHRPAARLSSVAAGREGPQARRRPARRNWPPCRPWSFRRLVATRRGRLHRPLRAARWAWPPKRLRSARAAALQNRMALACSWPALELFRGDRRAQYGRQDRPRLMNDSEFRGLAARPRAMAGRYDDAQADFSSPVLVADPASASVARLCGRPVGRRAGRAPGLRRRPLGASASLPKWAPASPAARAEAALSLGDLPGAAQRHRPGRRPEAGAAGGTGCGALTRPASWRSRARSGPALASSTTASSFCPTAPRQLPAQQRSWRSSSTPARSPPPMSHLGLDPALRRRGDATELRDHPHRSAASIRARAADREVLDALQLDAGRRLPFDLPTVVALQNDPSTCVSAIPVLSAAALWTGLEPVKSAALFCDFENFERPHRRRGRP